MNISKRKQGILAIICTIAMIVTSITVYNPREVKAGQSDAASYDYSTTAWLGDGAGGGKYNNKYKLAPLRGVSNIDNIQKPPFATADGIYMALATDDVKKVTVNGTETSEYDMQGAGMLLHLAAMTEKYNDILIYNSKGEAFAELYGLYADGTDSGTVEPVEKPAAPADLKVSFNEEEKTCTISFGEVEGITTYNFYVGGEKIGTVPENKTFNISDLNVEEGKEYIFGVTSVNAKNVESNKATTKATTPVFSAPSAPTQIYASINPAQTDYTVGVVQAVTGAKGYRFYINGEFAKEIAKDQVITIAEMEEKYGLKRGEDNTFGISAFNDKGESARTEIKVSVPAGETFENGKELIPNDRKSYSGKVGEIVGGNPYDVQNVIKKIKFEQNKWYVVKFSATCDVNKKIQVRVQEDITWHNEAGGHYNVALNAGESTDVIIKFKANKSTDEGMLNFCMGYVENTVSEEANMNISNISLIGYNDEPQIENMSEIKVDGNSVAYVSNVTAACITNYSNKNGYGYFNAVDKKAYYTGEDKAIPVSDKGLDLKSIALNVTMTPGASIRLAAPTGLRFQTTVESGNDIAVDDILDLKTGTVTTGTLITTRRLYEANDNTLTRDSDYKFLDIENDGWFNDGTKTTTGKFCGSIVRIKDGNYDREFIAVGYATINYSNGDPKTVYAEVTVNNAKSIQYVANKVKASEKFSGYTAEQKNIIEKYIANRKEILE